FEGHLCLLTDTVGFIDRLPLTLVSSFLNTLAETIFSDLIILVVDVSEPIGRICRKIECCRTTLEDIGANQIPTLVVFSKKDLIKSNELKEKTVALQSVVQDFVVISALRGENLDSLQRAVIKRLPRHLNLRLILPTNDEASHFLSWLYDRTKLSKVTTTEDKMKIDLEAPPRFIGKIQGYVSRLNGEIKINDYT
ncbi:MAG: hypothetical protein JSW01_01880, partial [Candidatus Bathyarchaeota archaeon]